MRDRSAELLGHLPQAIRAEPVEAARVLFGLELWGNQAEIVRSVFRSRKTAAKTCHKVGKSLDAAVVVVLWLIAYPGAAKVVTTAPGQRQVREIIWQEIRALYARARARGFQLGPEPLVEKWELGPNWIAIGVAPDKYNDSTFQGFNSPHALVIVDEASGVTETIFEGAKAITSNEGSALLYIGNPTNPAGTFARAFRDPTFAQITISAYDSPNFRAFGIERADVEVMDGRGSWVAKVDGRPMPHPHFIAPEYASDVWIAGGRSSTNPVYMGRVLGLFPEVADDTLIPLHWIEAAQRRWGEREPGENAPRIVAADVARYGSDETVLGWRHGHRFRVLQAALGWDTMRTTGEVVRRVREAGATEARVDVVGIGAGVVDRLEELHRAGEMPARVVSFGSGERARDPERFANLRAEGYWTLRERYEAADIEQDPSDAELAAQLSGIRYKVDSRGRTLIESKDEARRRGVGSPDRADTAMMAFAVMPEGETPFAAVW